MIELDKFMPPQGCYVLYLLVGHKPPTTDRR